MPETPVQTWRAHRSTEYVAAVYEAAKRVNVLQVRAGLTRTRWEDASRIEQHIMADWVEAHLVLHQAFFNERTERIADDDSQ